MRFDSSRTVYPRILGWEMQSERDESALSPSVSVPAQATKLLKQVTISICLIDIFNALTILNLATTEFGPSHNLHRL